MVAEGYLKLSHLVSILILYFCILSGHFLSLPSTATCISSGASQCVHWLLKLKVLSRAGTRVMLFITLKMPTR